MYSTIVQVLSSNIIVQFHHGVTIYIYTCDSHSPSLIYWNTSVLANISKPNPRSSHEATPSVSSSDAPHFGHQSEGPTGTRDVCCSHVRPMRSHASPWQPNWHLSLSTSTEWFDGKTYFPTLSWTIKPAFATNVHYILLNLSVSGLCYGLMNGLFVWISLTDLSRIYCIMLHDYRTFKVQRLGRRRRIHKS